MSILPFISELCNASFKCKYKSIELSCGITEITQFIHRGTYMNIYFVLTRTVETLQKINSFYFPPWYVHFLPTLPTFSWLMSEERWKGRGTMVVSYFPFHLCHHFSLSDSLTQGSNTGRKGYDQGSLVLAVSYDTYASFRIWSKLVLVGQNTWSLRAVSAPAYSGIDKTHLPGSCWTSTLHGSTRILCSRSITNAIWEWGTCTLSVKPLFMCTPHRNALQSYISKVKDSNSIAFNQVEGPELRALYYCMPTKLALLVEDEATLIVLTWGVMWPVSVLEWSRYLQTEGWVGRGRNWWPGRQYKKIRKKGRRVVNPHNWICWHMCRQLPVSLYIDVQENTNTPTGVFLWI